MSLPARLLRLLLPPPVYLPISLVVWLHTTWAAFLLFDDGSFLTAMRIAYGRTPSTILMGCIFLAVAALAGAGTIVDERRLSHVSRVLLLIPQQVLLLWGVAGIAAWTTTAHDANITVTWGLVDTPLLLVALAHTVAVWRIARG